MNAKQRTSLSHQLRKILKEEFGLVPIQAKSTLPEHTIHREPDQPERTIESVPQLDPPPESKTTNVSLKWVYRLLVWARSKVSFGLATVAIVGSFASIAAVYPQFQFAIQPPLDPANVFSSLFTVQYNGPIPIYNVEFHCVWEEVSIGKGAVGSMWMMRGLDMYEKGQPKLPQMLWGDAETIPCNNPFTNTRELGVNHAVIQLWVDYSPAGIPLLRKSRIAKFATETQSDHILRFVQRAQSLGFSMPSERAKILTGTTHSITVGPQQ